MSKAKMEKYRKARLLILQGMKIKAAYKKVDMSKHSYYTYLKKEAEKEKRIRSYIILKSLILFWFIILLALTLGFTLGRML